MIKKVLYYVFAGFFIFMMLLPAFENPNLTQTQLFLTYWQYYLGMTAGFGAILWGLK